MTQDQWMKEAEARFLSLLELLRERCAAIAQGMGSDYPESARDTAEAIRAIELDVAVREFSAHLQQRPLPVREPTDEATTDQLIELAGALEQRRALAIAEAVSAISGNLIEGAFRDGFDSACEEITQRLRTEVWDGCLPPVSASPSVQNSTNGVSVTHAPHFIEQTAEHKDGVNPSERMSNG